MNMKSNRSGFSMIEVLVASTIMMMMVMMLGMLFQQTSLAWRTGKQRADIYQQVRALFGAIQRDASAAVDKDSLPRHLFQGSGAVPDLPQTFNGSSLSFYTLTGTGFTIEEDAASIPLRSITYVKYSGVKRTVSTFYLLAGGGGYTPPQDKSFSLVDVNLQGVNLTTINFQEVLGPSGNFPSYVTVSAGVTSQGMKSFDVGAASGGPDRTLGTSPTDVRSRDDIKTWVQ